MIKEDIYIAFRFDRLTVNIHINYRYYTVSVDRSETIVKHNNIMFQNNLNIYDKKKLPAMLTKFYDNCDHIVFFKRCTFKIKKKKN